MPQSKTETETETQTDVFYLVEQHKSCVQIHVHLLTRSITSETYTAVYVDKNTLQSTSFDNKKDILFPDNPRVP